MTNSVLVLETLASSKAQPPDLDPLIPHGINHLLLGQLGLEEIIVCACDDGDVYAYYVRAIFNTVRSSREPPRAFFHENVGASAWGLAIHLAAKLIAISSNNHTIEVFSLALVESIRSSDTTSESLDDETPDISSRAPPLDPGCDNPLLLDRSITRHLRLEGHEFNIPSIAFYDGDNLGRWLVSTDINGVFLVWDLLERGNVKNKILFNEEPYFFDEVDNFDTESVPDLPQHL